MSDETRYWTRLRVNGAVVDVAGEVAQQESLEQMDALTATCRVAGAPTVGEGQSADLYLVDLAAGTGVPQLSGEVDLRRAVGRPHEQYLILVGQLGKTTQVARKQADGDLNLTGMTDGAAVQAVLAYCGVAFTVADIADAAYVLGDKKAVYWKVGVSGADMIAELDRVFQMRTVEVGAGRVVRFRYDAAPQLADAVATYERGVSAFFFNAERERGRFREIRNVVDVTGATYDCGDDDSCSCQIAAHGEADNADLGAGVRTVAYPFASELIQSTGLAEEVAKDLMRRLNRKVDRVACFGENDPNQTVGKVISVTDAAAGIDLTTATAYQIFAVRRIGNRMRLDCYGGAAGDTGTVTSSIEQVCQDASFTLPPDPSFAMPSVTFPPVVGGISIPDGPCVGDNCGGPEGEDNPPAAGTTDLLASKTDWVCDFGSCDLGGPEEGVRMPAVSGGHTTELDLSASGDWTVTGTIDLASGAEAEFALARDASFAEVLLAVADGFETECSTPDGGDALLPAFALGAVAFTITHDHGAGTTRFQVSQGATAIDETFAHATHSEPNRYVCFDCSAGEATLSDCTVQT